MIGIKLWGGLGNQFFQYAFGLYLSDRRGEKPFFYGELLKDKKLDLNYFNVAINILDQEVEKKYGCNSNYFLIYRIKRKLIQLFPFSNKRLLVEYNLEFKKTISDKYFLFDGYWQSYKYLKPIEKVLRQQFVLNSNLLPDLEIYNEIRRTNSISLHIRRGDYLNRKNTKIFESISMEYYEKAINFFLEKKDNPVFYVFSNDLNWVRINLNISNEATFVFVDNKNYENTTTLDLYLMSSCKHHIIANSTFSWWGAWLNSSKDKIVIAPKKWYVGKKNDFTIDLIPPDWLRF